MVALCGLGATLSLSAVTVPFDDVSVDGELSAEVTISLPAGAEYLRVSGDWAATAGSPQSDSLELEIVGPGEITAFVPVFSNAAADSSSVSDLNAIAKLTSASVAGDYTLRFTNGSAASTVSMTNGSVELLALQEGLTDSGSIGPASPTFTRPEEDGSFSGRSTRYAAYQFTPGFSGTYTIDSQQGFDGFIALYSGSQATAPFADFIAANDDSAGGESFSRLEVELVSGQTYTLVTTSYSESVSGSFTNRIRTFEIFVPSDEKATTYEDYADQRGFVEGPEVDESGNGLENLLEYALGREADSPNSPPLEIRIEGSSLIGRFYRDPELTDIAYILEATSSLSGPWTEIYNSSTDLQANADGDFQEIEDVAPVSGNRFLRLRVVFSGPLPFTYAAYAAEYALGGPEADDNENGLSNLLEYALGRVPDSPYAAPLEIFFEDGRLVGRFYRDPDLTDIDYILLATSDLTTPLESWEVIYDSSVDFQANSDGDFQEIEDSELLSRQRFFRLQIRQPE